MEVGDVVIQREGPWSSRAPLVCGSGMYTHAICVSVEPFVLVSEEGDMMWCCLNPDNYVGLCRAHGTASRRAFKRYKESMTPAQKESEQSAVTGEHCREPK